MFNEQLKIADKDYESPTMFWGDKERTIYTSIYFGWLIANNKFDERNYV